MIGSVPLLFPRNTTTELITGADRTIRAIAVIIGVVAIVGIDYARSHLTRYEDKK